MMSKLPFFTPLGWGVLFAASVGVGIWIAFQMMVIRGL